MRKSWNDANFNLHDILVSVEVVSFEGILTTFEINNMTTPKIDQLFEIQVVILFLFNL
jgi:hypothetical protein